MAEPRLITLTTDFGSRDWFVGTMKGVMQGIAPKAKIIDLTHEIAPGDIRAGAFVVAASYRFFPKGTVHVAVVDPGVGSARQGIAVKTRDYFFVGPDNGVLSWVLAQAKIQAARSLENERYFLAPVSRTFHGRDIFAPVAAHLCRGVPIQSLGPTAKHLVRLDWPTARKTAGGVRGEVVYIDRFGNAITNIDASDFANRIPLAVALNRKRLCTVAEFYQAVPPGSPVAVLGSSGLLEIAINGGNAAQRLGIQVGSAVLVAPARKASPSAKYPLD